ncbi:hypothetical protein HZA73_01010 [candidate division TA06 bacterium]|nr:hypothetical protein [candidate division TA06 bacterium]
MRRFLLITGYLLLLAFGLLVVIRGYQEVMLIPALLGLVLVVALILLAIFRHTLYKSWKDPKTGAALGFVRYFLGRIGWKNLLYALPYLVFCLGFLYVFRGLRLQPPGPLSLQAGKILLPWYLSEIFALFFSPFIVWIFLRDDDTPRWQRIVSIPVMLLIFGGFMFFVKIMQLVWVFVLLKCAHLYFQRPTVREHMMGCLQSILNAGFWLVLGLIFLNRPDYTMGLMEYQPREVRVMGSSMLFGCFYFGILGISEIFYRPFIFAVYYYRPVPPEKAQIV